MKTRRLLVITLMMPLFAATMPAQAYVTADVSLEDDKNALMARQQAKASAKDESSSKRRQSSAGRKADAGSKGCSQNVGNVNLGNSRSAPREVTIIVTGPVIQANKGKC